MSKTSFIAALLLWLSIAAKAQQPTLIQRQIDSLVYLNRQPFDCNSAYWRVVAAGKKAIPFLITKLIDTTATNVMLTCKTTNVKLGDICYDALNKILFIPVFDVLKMQFDEFDTHGCMEGLFDYLNENRQLCASKILAYYTKHKSHLTFIRDYSYLNKSCEIQNNIRGYYHFAD